MMMMMKERRRTGRGEGGEKERPVSVCWTFIRGWALLETLYLCGQIEAYIHQVRLGSRFIEGSAKLSSSVSNQVVELGFKLRSVWLMK